MTNIVYNNNIFTKGYESSIGIPPKSDRLRKTFRVGHCASAAAAAAQHVVRTPTLPMLVKWCNSNYMNTER